MALASVIVFVGEVLSLKTKLTVAVSVTPTASAVAVYTAVSIAVLVAVKLATPAALLAVLAGEITEVAPASSSVTVLPDSGLPPASSTVTVIVVVSVPLFRTLDGAASTVDVEALTGPRTIV